MCIRDRVITRSREYINNIQSVPTVYQNRLMFSNFSLGEVEFEKMCTPPQRWGTHYFFSWLIKCSKNFIFGEVEFEIIIFIIAVRGTERSIPTIPQM